MDEQLKQRLIGASIIVAFAVIFVPMLFDKKPDEPSSAAIAEIPPMPKDLEEQPIELPRSVDEVATSESSASEGEEKGDRIIPISEGEDNEAVEDGKTPAGSGAGAGAGPNPERGKPAQKSIGEVPPAPGFAEEDLSDPEEAARPKVSPGKPANPERQADGRKKAAPPAVPPATGKPPADKPNKTVVKTPTPEPQVRKSELAESTPAAAPSAWLVQAGSFVSEHNAKALVEKLRQNKLSAYAETVHGNSGRVTYRVRIGPDADKVKAEQTLKQLEAVAGIRGYIVPYGAK